MGTHLNEDNTSMPKNTDVECSEKENPHKLKPLNH